MTDEDNVDTVEEDGIWESLEEEEDTDDESSDGMEWAIDNSDDDGGSTPDDTEPGEVWADVDANDADDTQTAFDGVVNVNKLGNEEDDLKIRLDYGGVESAKVATVPVIVRKVDERGNPQREIIHLDNKVLKKLGNPPLETIKIKIRDYYLYELNRSRDSFEILEI